MKPDDQYNNNDTTNADKTELDSARQGSPDSDLYTKALSAVQLLQMGISPYFLYKQAEDKQFPTGLSN